MDLTPTERKSLAVKLQVNEQYLYQCLTGRRDMDPVEAVRIERESAGRISRFALCQRRGANIWPEQAAANDTPPVAFKALPAVVQQRSVGEG